MEKAAVYMQYGFMSEQMVNAFHSSIMSTLQKMEKQ